MQCLILIALLGLSATRFSLAEEVQVIANDEKEPGVKRTTVIIPNGMSHKVTCPTIKASCPVQKNGKIVKGKDQEQVAGLESAQYWQAPGDDEEVSACPSTDVLSQLRNGACKGSSCSFQAKDPAKTSECNTRALMVTYSCTPPPKPAKAKGATGCIMVNNMIDDR